MALCGDLTRKKSGSPGSSARNADSDPGRQKFTSSIGGTIERSSDSHSKSVFAMNPRIRRSV
jgi:hypothetical protein